MMMTTSALNLGRDRKRKIWKDIERRDKETIGKWVIERKEMTVAATETN